MIRILVVDDSAVLRQSTRFILESDPELKVIGEATNGVDAVTQVKAVSPDVITMDIRMPKMDGLEAIRQIMTVSPLPIVVVTSLDLDQEMGLSAQATRLGAVSILTRPAGISTPQYRAFATKLIEQVKLMSGVKIIHRTKSVAPSAPLAPPPGVLPVADLRPRKIDLVAIGSSTGGPAALHQILSALPENFATPILIVQHISFGFVEGLAGWLDAVCPLRVKVGVAGERIQGGTIYIAPDGAHLQADRFGKINLSQAEPVGGFRPSATPLFESVARAYGATALGVILTGMGSDGAVGMQTLSAAGAMTIAQDEASCVVFGMPKEAIALGAIRHIVPLGKIAQTLAMLCGTPVQV